jgi:hypothetical protein
MIRAARAVLAALAATACAVSCFQDAPPASAESPPRWVVPPPALPWLGVARGSIGRAQAPQVPVELGLHGDVGEPLVLPTPWAIPGDGPARAAVYGTDPAHGNAVELIDIDGGRVRWRVGNGAAPIVGVTAETIVMSDAHGLRALDLDGKLRWHADATFIAMTDDHVVTAGTGEAVILDASSGDELRRIAMPAGESAESILASCGDAGAELFAIGRDDRLERIADAPGGPKVTWRSTLVGVRELDACDGDAILALAVPAGGSAPTQLVAIARDTGAVRERIDGVRGWWPARDGAADRIEVATETGVIAVPRARLEPAAAVDLPPLGALLAKRGDRRLIAAGDDRAVLLDRAGVRAYLALHAAGAVLGDRAIVAASWTGSPAETVRRVAIPPRYRPRLRLAPAQHAVVPAELRDLPEVRAAGAAIVNPIDVAGAVAAVAVDPRDASSLVVVTTEPDGGAAVWTLDLAHRRWSPHDQTCHASGPFAALAFAADVRLCSTDGDRPSVMATRRDGSRAWDLDVPGLDGIDAAGDTAIAIAGARASVLDAASGELRATLASDDGDRVRAAVIEAGGETLVVAAERGRIVAHVPRLGMLPRWSIVVRGEVARLQPSDDGVLVALADGDTYRLDGETGHAAAIATTSPTATADHDLVLATDEDAGAWQLSLFARGGGLRARNDYALPITTVAPGSRGPAGSPLVWRFSRDGKDLALVLDPRTGDPQAVIDVGGAGMVFSSIVAGKPIAGAILPSPLRVVFFE